MQEDSKQEINNIQSQLSKYQCSAMKMINERSGKNLITADIFFEQYPRPELPKEEYLKHIEYGYTNSFYFEHIEMHEVKLGSTEKRVGLKPQKSYRLKEKTSPSKAIQDILENPNFVMVIDCQAAIIIAQYYAILNILKNYLGEEKGTGLFDECFSMSPSLLISRYTAESGSSKQCIDGHTFMAPFNPLAYFVGSHEDQIIAGCHLYFQNHLDYIKKHPSGDWLGHTVVCVSTQPNLYIGFNLKKPLTEKELSTWLCENYNKDSAGGKGNENYREVINTEDIPGLDSSQTRIIDADKIFKLIASSAESVGKFC